MTIYILGGIISVASWTALDSATSSWFRTVDGVRPGISGWPPHGRCRRGLLRLLCCRPRRDVSKEFCVPPPCAPRREHKSVAPLVTFDDPRLLVPTTTGMVLDQDCRARREGLSGVRRLVVMGFALHGRPGSPLIGSLCRQLPLRVERSPVCWDTRTKWVTDESLGW